MPAIAAIGKLTASIIGEFRNITGAEHVYLDEESLNKYGHDETENLLFLPEIVIKPRTAEGKNDRHLLYQRRRGGGNHRIDSLAH